MSVTTLAVLVSGPRASKHSVSACSARFRDALPSPESSPSLLARGGTLLRGRGSPQICRYRMIHGPVQVFSSWLESTETLYQWYRVFVPMQWTGLCSAESEWRMLQMKTAAASRGVVRSGTARVVPLLGARSARAWTAQRSFAVPSALGRLAFNQVRVSIR